MSKKLNISLMLPFAIFVISPVFATFQVWPLTMATVYGGLLIFVGLLALVTFCLTDGSRIKFGYPTLFFLSLIVFSLFSVYFNDFPFDASWKWYFIFLFCAVIVCVSAAEIKDRDGVLFNEVLSGLLWFSAFLAGSLSILKYYGLLSIVFPWAEPSSGRMSGIWYQSNLTTVMCWIGLVSGSVWFSNRRAGFWFYFSVFVFGWVISCAASRISILIAFFLVMLFFMSRLNRFYAEGSRLTAKLILISVIAVFIMMLVVPSINLVLIELAQNLGFLEKANSVSILDRNIAQDSIRLTELLKLETVSSQFSFIQLFIGLGPSNYPGFSFQSEAGLNPENLAPGVWLHSHNIFSMIFVEFGALGLGVIVAFVIFIIGSGLKQKFDDRVMLSLGVLGILFIHSNLEYPLWNLWFLLALCLVLVNLFTTEFSIRVETAYFKRVLGISIGAIMFALFANVGAQYIKNVKVAMTPNPDITDYQSLSVLANDSLMGPYMILRRYRDFAPESRNLQIQLDEVRRMKRWQPRDLVLLREYTLLVMKNDLEGACESAEATAYRYPKSSPIMLEHAIKSGVLMPVDVVNMANCIERGLEPRGETIPSIEAKNRQELSRM